MLYYTYLIGWSKLNRFYYGCRYSKNCHPDDLWKTYFTSSKHVRRFRKEHGEPDIIEIRKTFESRRKCLEWETKVLIKLDVNNNDLFLNKTTNKAISPIVAAHAKGKTYEQIYGYDKAQELRKSRSLSNSKRRMSTETKTKMSNSRLGKYKGNNNPMSSIGQKLLFWNNGVITIRKYESPGEGWVRGVIRRKKTK